jgi:hypothetical protein
MTNHGQVDANLTYFYYDLYPYSDEWTLFNSDHDGLIVPANSTVTFTRYPPVSCTAGERPYGFFDSYISIGYESVEGVSQEDFERCIYLEGFYIPPQDSTAPLISVGGSLDLDATALTVSVTDDHLYTYSLFVDGLFIDAGHVPGEGTDRVFTIDLGDLPDGVYDVTILVADLSLNNVRLDLVLDVTGGVGTTTTTSDTTSTTSTTSTPSTTSTSSTTTSDTGTSETTTSSATTSTSTSATSETSDPPGSTTTPNVPVRVPVLALLGVATVFVSRRRR